MSKIQLTISPGYVRNWGTLEGLRELMQNSIDRQNESPDSTIILNYEPLSEILLIGNRQSKISVKSLLLGETTKSNNKKAIGTYGEGYKLAFLVLLRNGITITVENCSEQWEPYFINSRTFNSKVLTIKTSKGQQSNDLVFRLKGIAPETYNDFQNKCLYFHPNTETIDTDYGRILLEEKYQKQVYVEGLYVCKMNDNLKYGYDMKAAHCKLDRDRNKVQSFNLLWELGMMYASLSHQHSELIHELRKYDDCEHFNSHAYRHSKLYQDVCDLQYEEFLKKHGQTAVFVETEDQARHIREKYNDKMPVILPKRIYERCNDSPVYRVEQEGLREKIHREDTPYTLIEEFLKENKKKIFGTAKKVIEEKLLPMSRNWKIRK